MSIKEYIINNFKEDNIETLENAINECIKEQDEETLPGMGVFLELIWKGSNETQKKSMLDTLYKELRKKILLDKIFFL